MLVLTRKLDEQIHIGKDVTITIVRVRGGAVRIGIEAPREVQVRRAELPLAEPVCHRAEPHRARAAIDSEKAPGARAPDRSPVSRSPEPRSRGAVGPRMNRPR